MKPNTLLVAVAGVVVVAVLALGVVLLLDGDDETLTAADATIRPAVPSDSVSPDSTTSVGNAPSATTAPSTMAAPTSDPATATTLPRVSSTTRPLNPSPPPPTTLAGVSPNSPPRVSITSPGAQSRFAAVYDPNDGTFGAAVSLAASVSDPEGDPVTVQWFSSTQGFLGTGTSISVRLRVRGDASQPVITAVATDATGARGEASTQIIVWIPSDQ